jgi:hypothetical protein
VTIERVISLFYPLVGFWVLVSTRLTLFTHPYDIYHILNTFTYMAEVYAYHRHSLRTVASLINDKQYPWVKKHEPGNTIKYLHGFTRVLAIKPFYAR